MVRAFGDPRPAFLTRLGYPGMRDSTGDIGAGVAAPEQVSEREGVHFRGVWAGAAPAAVMVAVGVFYLLTIRPGHTFGDDFAQYIHHAKNLVEGRPYGNTGHIYNPHGGDAPLSYPPVFPLLLMPVYAWFGVDLTAMKVEGILIWLAALAMLLLVFRRALSPPAAVGLIAIVGFNPVLWEFKDVVAPEFSFVFFLALATYLIDRWHGAPSVQATRAIRAVVLGLAIYLAYGTRSIGGVLIPSLLILDLFQRKRLRLETLATLAVFGGFFLLKGFLLGSSASANYQDDWPLNPALLLRNLQSFRWALHTYWDSGYFGRGKTLLFVLVSALALIGYVTRARRGLTIHEVFPVLYLGVLLVYPYAWSQIDRYWIAIFPWFVFFLLTGVESLRRRMPAKASLFAQAFVAFSVVISYAGSYTKRDFGPIRGGITEPEVVQLFAYIRQHANPNDVFIFTRPLALALYGERACAAYTSSPDGVPHDAEKIWTLAREIHATHLIIGTGQGNPLSEGDYIWSPPDGVFLRQFASTNPDRLTEVFSNPAFVVYRIANQPAAPQPLDGNLVKPL